MGNTFIFGLLMSMNEDYLLPTILQAKGSKGAVDFVCEREGRCLGAGKWGKSSWGGQGDRAPPCQRRLSVGDWEGWPHWGDSAPSDRVYLLSTYCVTTTEVSV